MSDREHDPNDTVVIGSAEQLLRSATRRKFVRAMGVGGAVVFLPGVFGACDDDDDPVRVQSPPPPPASPPPPPFSPPPPPGSLTAVTFDLRSDVGIFRLVHVLEMVERAFYTAVVTKANFGSLFDADAQETLRDIRNAETIHEAFVRNALGSSAVPDISGQLNPQSLANALATRETILDTARTLESFGVSGLNGGGKYIRDARNLLLAGKIVSVEARHLAAIRSIRPPTGVDANLAFASDDTIDANGRDIKLEAGELLTRVKAANFINEPLQTNIFISDAPTAAQGVATADFFPANP